MAKGLSILTTPGNVEFLKKLAAAPKTRWPDALSRQPRAPMLETFSGKRVLSDGVQTLELRQIGPGPPWRMRSSPTCPRAGYSRGRPVLDPRLRPRSSREPRQQGPLRAAAAAAARRGRDRSRARAGGRPEGSRGRDHPRRDKVARGEDDTSSRKESWAQTCNIACGGGSGTHTAAHDEAAARTSSRRSSMSARVVR